MSKQEVFQKILPLFVYTWTLMIISCQNKQLIFKGGERFNGRWPKNKPAVFDFNIDTPQEIQDFLFVLRHNDSYEFSNIFLFIETQYPDGKSTRDTVQYKLAYKDGHWKGIGLGPTKEILLRFKEKATLKDSGHYKIMVLQDMRRDTLQGIEDFSLIIEKPQHPDV
ncbi:MAG: gliding motility lipoprotein GldH [Flavobacteriales bacterium]